MFIGLALLIALPPSTRFLFADQDELNQIRNAIREKGARWHADETSMSRLTQKEKKMRLGAREDEDLLAWVYSPQEMAPVPEMADAPATLDWRNAAGVNYVSPVKNQGSCGSCWAFATTAGLESQVMISGGGVPVDLSEQILVSCSGVGSCSGGSSSSASNYIRDVGLPLESCFRYTATNNLCSNACLDWQNSTYSINGWHRASDTTITAEAIRNAIYAYGPIVATMSVYNDFYSYRSGVYSYATGSYVGAHAVLVVGYDDAQQAFVVKNSWGTGWGEAGFFMIGYSEVGGTSRFGYSTMVYDGYGDIPDPGPTPDPDPVPCSYSLSSSGATFRPAGGTGSFTLRAQGSCSLLSLNPTSSATWVNVSSTSIGNGSVTVSYKVEANSGPVRSASIDIAGLSYTISQQKAKPSKTR